LGGFRQFIGFFSIGNEIKKIPVKTILTVLTVLFAMYMTKATLNLINWR